MCAMTLDNSWKVISEEEMYDVNGGKIGSWDLVISNDHIDAVFAAICSAGIYAVMSAISIGLTYINAIPYIGNTMYVLILGALKACAVGIMAAVAFGTDFVISVSNRTISVWGKSLAYPTGISFSAS